MEMQIPQVKPNRAKPAYLYGKTMQSHAGSLEYTAPHLSICTHSLRTTFAKVHQGSDSQANQSRLFREGGLKETGAKMRFRQRANTGIFRQTDSMRKIMCFFEY